MAHSCSWIRWMWINAYLTQITSKELCSPQSWCKLPITRQPCASFPAFKLTIRKAEKINLESDRLGLKSQPWISLVVKWEDSMLSMQRAQVQYLVREIRFHMPRGMAKKVIIIWKKKSQHLRPPNSHSLWGGDLRKLLWKITKNSGGFVCVVCVCVCTCVCVFKIPLQVNILFSV